MKNLAQLLLIIGALAVIVFGRGQYDANTSHDELRLWFLDVGQGDAILIDTPNQEQILIDGGPDSSVVQELSRALPFNDKDIDLVISTHNDADHLSGLRDVLRHYTIKKIWLTGAIHTTDTYREFLELIKEKQIPTEAVRAGTSVRFGQLEGLVLAPSENYQAIMPESQNVTGIVTYWVYGTQTFLLTADIEKEQEALLLQRGAIRHADILKLAHHGSKTSSTDAFLRAVSPKVAVISVGAKNRYGHPSTEVLNRLTSLQIPTLRTDQQGTIRFNIWPDRFSY